LAVGVAATFACLAWILWSVWDAYESVDVHSSQQLQLQRLMTRMARLDGLMTASARATAIRGERQGERPHQEARPEFAKAFETFVALAPQSQAQEPGATHANRVELSEIEARAIEAAKRGRRAAASDLLFGAPYEDARQRHNASVAFLAHATRGKLDQTVARAKERFTGVLLLGVTLTGVLALVWIGIAASIRRNLAELARAEQERRALAARIQNAQRLESLSVLAGGIAHDFNNLLTGILSNAGTARRKLAASDPAQQHLSEIVQGSKLAGHLTAQLLAYAGKGQFQIIARDLSAEVGEIQDLLETSVRRRARLSYDLAEHLPAVQVDPSQLQQALMNLILNASESIEGEVDVTIRTYAVTLAAADIATLVPGSSLAPGEAVALEVEDSGWGMDDDTLARIFDPFFTTKTTGRGLGLAATLGIAHRHGGGIQVQSRLSKGTLIRVLFPASDQPVSRTPTHTMTDLSGQGLVLVVDDDDYILQAVYATLESYGYSVLLANTGRQAIEIYEQRNEEIDLVLLDMSMPGMSGDETYRALRQIRPDARVLLSTGYAPDEAAQRFTGTGLAGFLRKPYDTDELAESVKRLVGHDPEPLPTARLDDALRGLRESYRRKLPGQLDTLGEALRRAREPGEASHAEDARALSHRLAGTAGSYGFNEINGCLERVDAALRELAEQQGSPDELWKKIDASMVQVWETLAADAEADTEA
jgi:signal transduction histidine kinase/FixJ family two-component response regulator